MNVRVTSAKKISATVRKSLQASLAKAQNSQIVLEEFVDPKIIGGLKVQIGSKLIDGSTVTRLNAMKNAMRAS